MQELLIIAGYTYLLCGLGLLAVIAFGTNEITKDLKKYGMFLVLIWMFLTVIFWLPAVIHVTRKES